jgi:hypothetical protein
MASAAASETSCVRAVQFYVNKILRPRDRAREVTGMKCLLLDRDTKGMVAMVFSMGELLQRDVFLVETLDAKHEALGHLKAVCLLRPTQANVKELCRHLREPKFLEYHVFLCVAAPAPPPPPPPLLAAPRPGRPAVPRLTPPPPRLPTLLPTLTPTTTPRTHRVSPLSTPPTLSGAPQHEHPAAGHAALAGRRGPPERRQAGARGLRGLLRAGEH